MRVGRMEPLIVDDDSPNRYDNRRKNCQRLFGIVSSTLFLQILMIILVSVIIYQLKPLVNEAYEIVDDIKPILSKLKSLESLDLRNFNFSDINMTAIHDAINTIPEMEKQIKDFEKCLGKSHLCRLRFTPEKLTICES